MRTLFLLLFSIISFGYAQAQNDTIPVYFATGKAILSEGVQNQLTEHIYDDVLHAKQAIQIVGYADYVGGSQYNDQLSKARAATVKKFLLGYGSTKKTLLYALAKAKYRAMD